MKTISWNLEKSTPQKTGGGEDPIQKRIDSLCVTPYVVGANQIIHEGTLIRNEHRMYTTAGARINATWSPHPENQAIENSSRRAQCQWPDALSAL